MIENDNLESFSQTFSQCSLGDEVFQIDSQTLDPSIFEKNTPDIEFLCVTNEKNSSHILCSQKENLDCSQTENLIGFEDGRAIIQQNNQSTKDDLSGDYQSSSEDESLSVIDSINTSINIQHIVQQETENLENENDCNISNDENSTLELNDANSPNQFGAYSPEVVVEEIVSTTCEESQISIIELNQNKFKFENNLENMDNEDYDIIIEELPPKNIETKIHNYIEIKTTQPTRGRPIIVSHKIPNLNKINDPGKLKYVSRRYKNNIASQQSRIKRNIKGKELKQESKILEEKNKQLMEEKQKLQRHEIRLTEELEKRDISIPANYYRENSTFE